MIKYVIGLIFSVSVLNAQNDSQVSKTDIQVGDTFEIGHPEKNKYQHIDFPRANFIIKRGGIANYMSVVGEKVVVTSLKEKKDGTTQAKIKRTDGGRFFGSHATVTIDYVQALRTDELLSK